MQALVFYLMKILIFLLRIMPFGLIYVFSDLTYFVLYYLVGYRRKVVVSNLRSSFPEKSPAEITKLTKQFYHHLSDISVESIKGFSMGKSEIISRHHLLNPELADAYFEKGKSIICVPAHLNNWEWGSMSAGIQVKYPVVAFYKPMSNKAVDNLGKKQRSHFNTSLASVKRTADTFRDLEQTAIGFLMVADQSPSNTKDCYWVDFLNHDTPCLHGPEKYARLYNFPVIYVDIRKVKRGFYEIELIPLADNPALLPDGEITRLYMSHLEQSILKQPSNWLWSHRRWKHRRRIEN